MRVKDVARVELFRARGILLLVSIPILLAGLVYCARAGRRRERENPPAEPDHSAAKPSFAAGLLICIFIGIFGANINLGFAFGDGIIRSSQMLGGNAVTATYALWALVLGAGFIPNLIYCGNRLLRKNTWALFSANGSTRELIIGMSMGLLWLAGIVCYGFGATVAGKYGSSLGFALFLAVSIRGFQHFRALNRGVALSIRRNQTAVADWNCHSPGFGTSAQSRRTI